MTAAFTSMNGESPVATIARSWDFKQAVLAATEPYADAVHAATEP
jgi:hypothetical protein